MKLLCIVHCLSIVLNIKLHILSISYSISWKSVIGGSTVGYLRDHCANNVYKLRRPLKFPTAIENKDLDVLVIGLKGMKSIKSMYWDVMPIWAKKVHNIKKWD